MWCTTGVNAWPTSFSFIYKLVIIKDYVGAFDRVTAAQCRVLSCEIETKYAATTKWRPNLEIAWHHDRYPRDIIKPADLI